MIMMKCKRCPKVDLVSWLAVLERVLCPLTRLKMKNERSPEWIQERGRRMRSKTGKRGKIKIQDLKIKVRERIT